MLRQSLQQKLQQKLSPQQIQLIKLLEIPSIQLEQRIKKELEENPALEEGADEAQMEEPVQNDASEEDFSLDEYVSEDEIPAYKLSARNYSKDDKHEDIPFSIGTTFHEYLIDQLGVRILDTRQHQLAEYVIGNIDEDGYLRREVEAMVDDLAFMQGLDVTDEEMGKTVKLIQDFDPPGVGACDLQECLLLQLVKNENPSVEEEHAEAIIRNNFESFTKKHFEKIQKRLGISEEELKGALDVILHLNPKPGSSFSNPLSKSVQAINPDFILDVMDNEFQLSLNQKNVPELRVSGTYADMLQGYQESKSKASKDQKEAVMFVKQKLDSAKWFIDAIKQRQQTLLLTMNAILEFQQAYFLEGDETQLRPMILKDIAERTGLDVSTISRVSNSKYIQTPFGIYPLKYFFSESMQTETGEEVSTREIKKILEDCINSEDKRKPLTDDALAGILKEKGYKIARRTVAKYREQLGVSVARMRKEL